VGIGIGAIQRVATSAREPADQEGADLRSPPRRDASRYAAPRQGQVCRRPRIRIEEIVLEELAPGPALGRHQMTPVEQRVEWKDHGAAL
jgi:hypothetical protein